MALQRTLLAVLATIVASLAWAEPLTLPLEKRPSWLSEKGIVMAGSWEPLVFRVRRDGESYTPSAEQIAAYQKEHSPEMVARLKSMGVNFVMMHAYKGAGMEAERQSMADAVQFARLCRDAGMRVGVYNFSGAFLWEPFFKENPKAKDWVVLGPDGKPVTYGSAGYRYYWNRNHPDAQAFYQNLIRFAIEEIRTDLVHLDNYIVGPGHDAHSLARFREYLRGAFTPAQIKAMGIADLDSAHPPEAGSPALLQRAWQDFCCQSLAESYWAMSRYARSLRPDILMECNPGGVGSAIRPPVDHGRLLQGGEAYWVESGRVGYQNGRLVSRIANYKAGRAMDNITFDYTLTPLEMAESMAFNFDCLGCICWFEYGKIVAMPGETQAPSPLLDRYVRFFHKRRDLLRRAQVVADVAVLRSFASQVFGGPKCSQLTARAENLLIEQRVPFQIIYDPKLGDLSRYRALVLAGCPAFGDDQVDKIRRFAASGGRLCVVGPVATHDRWMLPRAKPALADLPASVVVEVPEGGDWLEAIRRACGGAFSLAIEAKPGLCAELTDQQGRRLVHLVNYRSDGPVRDVGVTLELPKGSRARRVTLSSPDHEIDRTLSWEQRDGKVRFTVPSVQVYEIAAVEMVSND